MAQLTCDFFSEALQMGTTMQVVLPQPTQDQVGVAGGAVRASDFPVLYLLHGLSDDHSAWSRYTSIERYAAAAGLAVVMPAAARSFYADEANGHRYWEFVAHELPEIVADFFRVSTARADTFVAGLSMGGYGALKLAAHFPGRYAAAASLSGVADLGFIDVDPDTRDVVGRVFGGSIGPEHDVGRLLDAVAIDDLPALHISCGLDDDLVAQNRDLVARLESRGARVTSLWLPGEHEWSVWDTAIAEVIDWLPVDPAPRQP